VVTTTPEKWDGISRNWQQRDYVQKVGLVIIDEIHLLGEDRGPILEVIVSRMRYIASVVDVPIRLIGLSTALANALDLADWLGIDRFSGLYNFRPSVRPVRLEVHISGFRGKHYCPRMATMNKPAFNAIKTYSPTKPALIFVSSRRQTRLTAIDLIACCASDDDPRIFLHMTDYELEATLVKVKDATLKHTLSFGIGLHHAGLPESDKALVEDLFGANKIQVLVSTATLAWGVNLPAHLVVVKGTEFYDAETKRYVDYPITDVLQMMGRAGRPQYDTEGFACVFVEESKKPFYTKFLYEPFPVESQLKDNLHDHMNAEIVAGTIKSKQDAVDYLTWTFFFRRLLKNPSYYGLENTHSATLNKYLSDLVDKIVTDLKNARCISVDEFGLDLMSGLNVSGAHGGNPVASAAISAHNLGRVASFYYLHYTTMQVFRNRLTQSNSLKEVLEIMCDTHEFSELPVRHNEDELNLELSKKVQWLPSTAMDSPHTKSNLLIQAHLSDLELPISDFTTDTRTVLDQTVRVAQAMVDVCAESGWLRTALNCVHLLQMCIQGRWCTESSLSFLPGLENDSAALKRLAQQQITLLPQLIATAPSELARILGPVMNQRTLRETLAIIRILPAIDVRHKVQRLSLNELGQTECTLTVHLNRTSAEPRSEDGIYAPKFSKHKDEGWWLIVGNEITGELLALRKLNNTRPKMSASLTFPLEEREGITLYFLSDCYIGLDQQYPITFDERAF
jgi:activating signal cointegrator complex subunit 3